MTALRSAASPGTRIRIGIVIAVAALTKTFAIYTAKPRAGFDIRVYHGALTYWIRQGGDLYEYLYNGGRYGFTYPPFAALSMLPMAYIGFDVVRFIHRMLGFLICFMLLFLVIRPVAQRHQVPSWFALSIGTCLILIVEPVRETLSFGQINLVLLGLVAADLLWVSQHKKNWAGVGIGLAAAIKLTPAIFILQLAIGGRFRDAARAALTATSATLLALLVAPHASQVYWTEAIWDTNRIGKLGYVSNQSLMGVLARIDPSEPNRVAWLSLALVVLAIWAFRVRAAARADDALGAFALTGLASVMLSPITWVHHLVWAVPALLRLTVRAWDAEGSSFRRLGARGLALAAFAMLCSRMVWRYRGPTHDDVARIIGANAYVWTCLLLLCSLPLQKARKGVAETEAEASEAWLTAGDVSSTSQTTS